MVHLSDKSQLCSASVALGCLQRRVQYTVQRVIYILDDLEYEEYMFCHFKNSDCFACIMNVMELGQEKTKEGPGLLTTSIGQKINLHSYLPPPTPPLSVQTKPLFRGEQIGR